MKTFVVFLFCFLVVAHELGNGLGLEIYTGPRLPIEEKYPSSTNKAELLGRNVKLPMYKSDWVVLMQRYDGSFDFNRGWNDYTNGFGDQAQGEFWLGLQKMFLLTDRFNNILRIEIQLASSGAWYWAEYYSFGVDRYYAIHVSGYSGDAGDPFTNSSLSMNSLHDGKGFSTRAVDHDSASYMDCATAYQAGWWFSDCLVSCLTCSYGYFVWAFGYDWKSSGPLKVARMMIKSR